MSEQEEFQRWKESQEKLREKIRNDIIGEHLLPPYSSLNYSGRELLDSSVNYRLIELNRKRSRGY